MNYYQRQLDKVNTTGQYAPSIKICSDTGNTNYLDLNSESILDVIEWLAKVAKQRTIVDNS